MHEEERKDLVELLHRKGIADERVLAAFMKVERHEFVPDVMKHHAYKDTALPIGYGQTISQPFTVAFMTQALQINEGDKVLEIGTGSGFQAAILYEMGIKVYSIERQGDIYNRTLKLFDELGVRAALRCADGTIGWSEYAPYDGIIVTAGGPTIPGNLKKQLKIGGKMVIPVGDRKKQTMTVLTKTEENRFEIEEHPHFAFVPLIGKQGWKNE